MTEHADHVEATGNVEAQVIELRQEDVVVHVKRVTTGKVKVASVTHVESAVIAQPLASETVEVTRLAVGRFVAELPAVRMDGDTTIWPVFEERYVLEKRIFLVEEVHIRNVRDVRSHREAVTYRKQDVVVERIPAHLPRPSSSNQESFMNDETIVAVYDTADAANNAIAALHDKGIAPANIALHMAGTKEPTGAETVHRAEPGFWEKLFGFSTDDSTTYDRSMSSGAAVVSVTCVAGETATVSEVLERFHPVDIDERGKSYASTGMEGAAGLGSSPLSDAPFGASRTGLGTPTAGAGMGSASSLGAESGKIELAEESVVVGKRAVNMGTARVRRYVVETPVSEQVHLRDETVTIERRPVTDGRKVTDADFSEKVIEMDETREEAVVSKTARVVEEVAISMQATERTETVHDTVRRDEVEITKAGETRPAGVGTTVPAAGTRTALND